MTLAFYLARGETEVLPLDRDPGRKIPTVAFDFSRSGKNRNRPADDWMIVRLPDPTFIQPPALLETRNAVSGVARHYRLPRGLEAEQIQTYARIVSEQRAAGLISAKKANDRMLRVLHALERLNPELKALVYDRHDPHKVSHTIWGVASAFNPKDLQFYLDGNTWGSSNESPVYGPRIRQLQGKLVQGCIGWVAAPETLSGIWAQVKDRTRPGVPQGPKPPMPPTP
jgi:hypothetical protein